MWGGMGRYGEMWGVLLSSGLASRCCDAKKFLLRSTKLSGESLPPEKLLPAERPPWVGLGVGLGSGLGLA